MDIFLSHSRRDLGLVNMVKKSLGILDYHPIIYEDLPQTLKPGKDLDNIRNLINQSQLVFLFLTSNVLSLKHTLSWVQYEDNVAFMYNKPLIIFQEEQSNSEGSFPILYFTDLIPWGGSATDPLKIQEIAKSFTSSGAVVRVVAGGAVGAIFGPIGVLLGALLGLASTPQNPLMKIPTVVCPNCN